MTLRNYFFFKLSNDRVRYKTPSTIAQLVKYFQGIPEEIDLIPRTA